ncbi:hypothetical protein V8G56_15465 [Gaetbulibacter aquiaggeris]|uniref:Uncharacterized protein n=1 Tax=Gaetbulibacter aquiaggeris TaxID=1735373 RepID=A0ABW7MTJ4_9FLAO
MTAMKQNVSTPQGAQSLLSGNSA